MGKYIDADHLKVEIEKHIKEVKDAEKRFTPNMGFFDAKLSGIYDVMAIIDSLPEETSCIYDTNKLTPTPHVNIEDVARVQFASHAHVFDRKRKAVFDWVKFKEVAGIFYGFGKRDSLPEEPLIPSNSVGLEEEIDNYFEGLWPGTETAEQCNTDLHFTPLAIMRLASHFAEWGAKH